MTVRLRAETGFFAESVVLEEEFLDELPDLVEQEDGLRHLRQGLRGAVDAVLEQRGLIDDVGEHAVDGLPRVVNRQQAGRDRLVWAASAKSCWVRFMSGSTTITAAIPSSANCSESTRLGMADFPVP